LALFSNTVLEHVMRKVMKTERNWKNTLHMNGTSSPLPLAPKGKILKRKFKRNRDAM
jgi:hypothetical protein